MKLKTVLCLLVMAAVMIPVGTSCSGGSSSNSPFGSLPEVYTEYEKAGEKLKEEAKNIKTEEDKAKYLKKSEKFTKKWSEKIEVSAKKLDGKQIDFAGDQFVATQPISFQFKNVSEKSQLYAVFNFNGSAETAEEIVLNRPLYLPSASVQMVGYDAEGQQQFSSYVGSVAVQDVDGKSVIPKGTPVTFNTFQFGGTAIEKYVNTVVLKLEILD